MGRQIVTSEQRATMKLFAAALDFADAEKDIRKLRAAVHVKACPAYERDEPETGYVGGPCNDTEECAICAARPSNWDALARARKRRHAARRKLLKWRERIPAQESTNA